MPLLVLRHGKQGVKRGLMGLQKLQLKTVIITLLCELESGGACVCARARVCGTVRCAVSGLRGVLIGPLIHTIRSRGLPRFIKLPSM